MLNLDRIVGGCIAAITPRHDIQIMIFRGQINRKGTVSTDYHDPFYSTCHTELANAQDLTHINGINITKIYRKFFIQSFTLSGLNRNLSTGGDLIIHNQIKYKIVSLNENFNTGWVYVIGCQDVNY